MVTIDQFIEKYSTPIGKNVPEITSDIAAILRLQYANAIAGGTWSAAQCPEHLRDEFKRIVTQDIRLRDLRALPKDQQQFRVPKNAYML